MSDPVAYIGNLVPTTAEGSLNWGGLAASIIGIVAIIKTALSSVVKIQTGERGVCLRFGKLIINNGMPKTVEPGLKFVWPFTHTIIKVSVQQRTSNLGDIVFEVRTSPKGTPAQWLMQCQAMWQVLPDPVSLASACFRTDNLDEAVVAIIRSGMRDVCGRMTAFDLLRIGKIREELLLICRGDLRQIGVELLTILPGTLSRTHSQVLADALQVPEVGGVNGKVSAIHSTSSQ